MSLDRQRSDNLSALKAGRPMPQYGRPAMSDRQIVSELKNVSFWDKLTAPGPLLTRITSLFNFSNNLVAVHRAELYPSPAYLSDIQVEKLYSSIGLRQFNYRNFEKGIYYANLFMHCITLIDDEMNVDVKTSHFLNMVAYGRNTIEHMWNIQYSIDGQFENALIMLRNLVAFLKLEFDRELINTTQKLNLYRASVGYPPIALEDQLVESYDGHYI